MNANAQVPAPVAEHRSLRVDAGSNRLSGFGNVFRKEMGDWFGTRRWWVQLILWVLIINVFMGFIMIVTQTEEARAAQSAANAPATPVDQLGIQFFFSFVVIAGAIGTIILAQDEIVGEKQSGTAAWILSKPVSRTAFVLGKLAANMLGILIFIVTIPGVIAYLEIRIFAGKFPAPLPFLGGMGIALLALFFYLTLSIFIGVIAHGRGPVIAVGLGILLGGSVLVQLWQSSALFLPLIIQQIATGVAVEMPIPSMGWIEVATTAAWCVVFAVAAPLLFRRLEL